MQLIQELLTEAKSRGWVAIFDIDYEGIDICASKEEQTDLYKSLKKQTKDQDMRVEKVTFMDGTLAVAMFDYKQSSDEGFFVAYGKSESAVTKKAKEMIDNEEIMGVDSLDDLYITQLK